MFEIEEEMGEGLDEGMEDMMREDIIS